jgi:uncharacterized protein YggE
MPEITVRGRAEARVAPTDAHVTVTVHARSTGGQADAVERCARQAAVVDGLLDAARDDLVRRVVTSSVRTGPEYEHSPKLGRRLVAWTATRTADVTCAPDGEGLTALLDALARTDGVRLDGPRWAVAADAAAWLDVRMGAAADARRRAEAYAAGLDVAVGRVVRITEPGLALPTGHAESAPMAFATRAMAKGGGEEVEPVAVRVVPEPVDVTVEVDVAFDLG